MVYVNKRNCSANREKCLFSVFIKNNKSDIINKSLQVFLKSVKSIGFHAIVEPVGGRERYFFDTENFKEKLPKINFPDNELTSQQWQSFVYCLISPFIDLDSSDADHSALSVKELEKELGNALYLGVSVVVIKLKNKLSTKLANFINNWINTKPTTFKFWIILPTNLQKLSNVSETDNLWSIWIKFRRSINKLTYLSLGLEIFSDVEDEFFDSKLLNQWIGEPLESLWINDEIFLSEEFIENNQFFYGLNNAQKNLIFELGKVANQIVFVSNQISYSYLINQLKLIDSIVNDEKALYCSAPKEALNMPQIPLQPLPQNLSCVVYESFEADVVKYKIYKKAIQSALSDILAKKKKKNESETIYVYVLGAGRGSLVDILYEIEKEKLKSNNFTLNKRAIEKNPYAFSSLEYKNKHEWQDSVTLFQCDMRDLNSLINTDEKADLVISELLGSFGDNELSPECLDGITNVLKKDAICIPQYYRNFIAPIHSANIYENLKFLETADIKLHTGRNLNCSNISNKDRSYVVCMQNVYLLSDPLQCFEFSHPNWNNKSNKREKIFEFVIPKSSELIGFVGFFEACLYGKVWISILPETHSNKMFSWSPYYFPIRKSIFFNNEEKIQLTIKRKTDDNGVWYEWCTAKIHQEKKQLYSDEKDVFEVVQNLNGESQYFKLHYE